MLNLDHYRTPGGLIIPADKWATLRSHHQDEELAEALNNAAEGMPMPDAEIGIDRAHKAFQELKHAALSDLLIPGTITLLRSPPAPQPDFHTRLRPPGNAASNQFFHRARLRTPKASVPSAWQKWHDHALRLKVFRRLLRLKKVDYINNATVRLALHMTGATPAQFKPGVAKAIYELTGAKRVLDFSMGWGDRLAGFCASSGTHYTGCDPNEGLHAGYRDMIQAYGQGKSITALCLPAEEMSFSKDQFDLVFSSPPYFGMEMYAEGTACAGTQSWARYPTPDAWLSGFLRPTLERSWHALAPGGVLAINIADVLIRRELVPLCAWTRKIVDSFPDASFQYALGMRLQGANYSDDRRQQVSGEPIWIWTKGTRELPTGITYRQEKPMSGKSKLDEENLRLLHSQGKHPDEVAAALGCHPGTVIQQWFNMGLEWIRKDDKRRCLSDDQELAAIQMYVEGSGATTIGKHFGTDKGTIYNILKRHKVGTRSVASRRTPHKFKGCSISDRDLLIKAKHLEGVSVPLLAEQVGVSEATIRHSLKKQGLLQPEAPVLELRQKTHRMPSGRGKGNRECPIDAELNHRSFHDFWVHAQYWCGFLLADGCVYDKSVYGQPRLIVQLCREDRHHLEAFKRWLGSNRQIVDGTHFSFGKLHEHSALTITSEGICDALKELGVVNHKEGRWVSAACKDSRDFWRGLMDGDGCLSSNFYLSGALPIIEEWSKYCDRVLGETDRVAIRPTRKEGVVTCYRGDVRYVRDQRILFRHLYHEAAVFLGRKFKAGSAL